MSLGICNSLSSHNNESWTYNFKIVVVVSVFVLDEKEFNSTCILGYSWCITSTMFFDDKAVLFWLLYLWFCLEAVCKVMEWQTTI